MAWTAPESYTLDQIIGVVEMHKIRDNLRELYHVVAYVEFASTVNSSNATLIDVVSAGAVTYAGFPIIIETESAGFLIAAGGGRLALVGDGTDLGTLITSGATSTYAFRQLTPTAASHTYKIQIAGTGGGATSTATAGAGGAGTNLPGCIRIWEKGGA